MQGTKGGPSRTQKNGEAAGNASFLISHLQQLLGCGSLLLLCDEALPSEILKVASPRELLKGLRVTLCGNREHGLKRKEEESSAKHIKYKDQTKSSETVREQLVSCKMSFIPSEQTCG